MRQQPTTRALGTTVLALVLGLGWAAREVVHARERADQVQSGTIALDQVKMEPYQDGPTLVGHAGLYLAGDTAASRKFVTGRFVIEPKQTPHAPHTHPEEEVMIIETGTGEIFVDGKTTQVGPGSVMYTGPQVSHGIVNTGDEPLTFYFIKWEAAATK